MRKLTILSLVFAVGLIAAGSLLSVKTSGQKYKFKRSIQPIAGRYIVVLNEDYVGRAAEGPVVEAEAQFLSSLYGGKVSDIYSSALKGYSVAMDPAEAEMLSRDDRVAFVEEDSVISISSTQTNAPWNLDRIDQRALPFNGNYEYTQTGAGANVYILDTGIRVSHQEFGGRASVAFDALSDGQNGLDCNGHGTHVAGTAVGATYGAAKNARVYSVRVLTCSGAGGITDLLRGIDWVTANRINPAVANISITAPGISPTLENAVANSVSSGVVYTIAAGNSQWNACEYTPARTPSAITVAASAEADDKALYSNYGPCVDLFAPGNAVLSSWAGSDSATRVMSGTSMAAPLVAGVAAIYRGANPSASPATVAQAVLNATTNGVVWNIDGTQSPNKLLYSWLAGGPSPTPTPTVTPTPTPTPTPTVTPTPTPTATPTPPTTGNITVKKRVRNPNGGTSSVAEFPYSATNIQTSTFTLVNNQDFIDSNVPASSQTVSVTESNVAGWRLVAVECVEVAGSTPNVSNTTVDLTNRRADIKVESGESVTCTFTSEELVPTAGGASVSGRVVDINGRGVRGITLQLFNASTGRVMDAMTNNFGYFTFDAVEVSTFYMLKAYGNKRYRFSNDQRTFVVNDDLANVDFLAESTR